MNENNNKIIMSASSSNKCNMQLLLPDDLRDQLEDILVDEEEDDVYLDLQHRELDDSMMPELCDWLVKLNGKVVTLVLGFNEVSSVGASMLFDTFRTNNLSLQEINFNANENVGDECMKSLGEYIKSNKSLEKFSVASKKLTDEGIKIFAPYLDGNVTLKSFGFSHCGDVTDKSTPLLIKMIESSHINDLDIGYTTISKKNIFVSALATNTLKYGSFRLSLRDKDMNDDDLIKMCELMRKYRVDKLKEINLSQNNITSKGISLLFDTLRECNSIVSKLYLSSNNINDDCIEKLGEFVQANTNIEIVHMCRNKISDKAVSTLSQFLIGNTILKELDIRDNKAITAKSVTFLIEIAKRSYVTDISLRDTSVSQEKIEEVESYLKIPIDKREIPIKSNTKSAAKVSTSR